MTVKKESAAGAEAAATPAAAATPTVTEHQKQQQQPKQQPPSIDPGKAVEMILQELDDKAFEFQLGVKQLKSFYAQIKQRQQQ